MQIHVTHSHKHTLWQRSALSISTLLLLGLAVACKDSSVVPDSGSANPATAASPVNPVTAPAAASSPGASAVTTASPAPGAVSAGATPAAPVPSATTTMTTANATILQNNPNAGKRSDLDPTGQTPRRIGDFPMEVGPARLPTPQPDPYKARPTPTITMENGKIKQQWPAPAEAAAVNNPVKNRPEMAKLGKELYEQRCLDCHGREGKGNGFMSVQLKREGQPIAPTNLTSQMVQANTDGELFWKITNGKSPMPASRVRFSDEERWAIVAYLRTLK